MNSVSDAVFFHGLLNHLLLVPVLCVRLLRKTARASGISVLDFCSSFVWTISGYSSILCKSHCPPSDLYFSLLKWGSLLQQGKKQNECVCTKGSTRKRGMGKAEKSRKKEMNVLRAIPNSSFILFDFHNSPMRWVSFHHSIIEKNAWRVEGFCPRSHRWQMVISVFELKST